MSHPWMASWPRDVSNTIDVPEIPLHHFLEQTAHEYPDTTAIIYYGHKTSYSQLLTMATRFAAALSHLDVRKDDKVALIAPNTPEYVIAFYGSLMAGATVVPCNPLYKERELEHQLNDSEAETIVALDLTYSTVQNILTRTKLKNRVLFSITDHFPFLLKHLAPLRGVRTKRYPNTFRMKQLLQKESTPPRIEINPKEDVAVILYTGGTTGTPKGAMLTHHNLVANALQAAYWSYGTEGKDKFLSALPFFHVYGLTVALNAPIARGGTLILIPRFEIKTVLRAINKYKPNYFPGVPAMYLALNTSAQTKKYDLSSIRYCISGAAPLPLEVMKKFEELTAANLAEGYGLTEASPVTHCNPLDDKAKKKSGSIGIPLPSTEARIADLENPAKQLDTDHVGELQVKGPQVMKGYWRKPQETERAFIDGWLRTGDIAKMDKDGYFYIVDRAKDMINVSGFKAWPREIEEVLFTHPDVKEAATIGIPDVTRGEVVKAFVVLREGCSGRTTEKEIIAFCKEKLAPYKVPRCVEFRDELPKTIIGKVLRRALRETATET